MPLPASVGDGKALSSLLTTSTRKSSDQSRGRNSAIILYTCTGHRTLALSYRPTEALAWLTTFWPPSSNTPRNPAAVVAKMHRNQQHSRDLISLTVKPGTETGLYYILVANVREASLTLLR